MARIAIIGSGISGMGAAYLLHRAGHAVTLYEKHQRIGGHTRTLTVQRDGTAIPVDTGFIVFNEPNYPNLCAMFKHLGVPIQKSDMSFAVTVDQGRFEWGARSLNCVFGQRRNLFNPRFWRLIRDVAYFNSHAEAYVAAHPDSTVDAMVRSMGLSDAFLDYYLLPMGGAIWSCPPSTMRDFPARSMVQFFKNHALLNMRRQHQWYTVSGGSQNYVDRLTASFKDHIRVGCAVEQVTRANGRVQVRDAKGDSAEYDRVVFASHADETLAMLADASDAERRILGAFQYQENIAYLHSDITQMPRRKACWASWVYQAQQAGTEMAIGVTYWMNLLQSIDERYPLFVTLNPAQPIDPALTYDRHRFTHPIFTREAVAAQAELPALQGENLSWFCGAYTRYGFHEDGLASAVAVATSMGVDIPWH